MGVPGQRRDGDRPSGRGGVEAVSRARLAKSTRTSHGSSRCRPGPTAETTKIKTIFTLDHKEFSLYRPLHVDGFELIPKQWP